MRPQQYPRFNTKASAIGAIPAFPRLDTAIAAARVTACAPLPFPDNW